MGISRLALSLFAAVGMCAALRAQTTQPSQGISVEEATRRLEAKQRARAAATQPTVDDLLREITGLKSELTRLRIENDRLMKEVADLKANSDPAVPRRNHPLDQIRVGQTYEDIYRIVTRTDNVAFEYGTEQKRAILEEGREKIYRSVTVFYQKGQSLDRVHLRFVDDVLVERRTE